MMSLGPKTITVAAGLILAIVTALPAQNLVINGNFEDGNTCQEFHLPCGPEAWVTLPVKTKIVFYGTDDKKKQGNHHYGAVLENINQPFTGRSYVQTMLCRPLVAGLRYCLRMRCHTGPAPFEQAGILLTNDEVIDGIDTLRRLVASFVITADSIKEKGDLKNWLTVQYTFTAAGGEQFLTIGNFSKTWSPRNKLYAHDVFGDMVLSMDDVSLLPEQPGADSDTSCDLLKNKIYTRHQRHTPYIYLLGEPKTAATVAAAPVKPSAKASAKQAAVTPPPPPPPAKPAEESIPAVNDTLRIPFDINSSRLKQASGFLPDSVLAQVLSKPYKSIFIAGYTDSTGPGTLNKALSLQRARTVADWLMRAGKISATRIHLAGKADEQPIAPNSTAEGRSLNRRVEIIIRRRD
ncbi:MAG TPA: OmpA family protein [Chitinophagaceae bacterium]